jgi:hypothetical protein
MPKRIQKIKLVLPLIILAGIFLTGCKDNSVIPPISEDNITLISTYGTTASTNGVFVAAINSRTFAFIADGYNGMQIIDVTSPNNPDSVSAVNTNGNANDITLSVVNGSLYAFVSDYNNGCLIVDVSDPYNPALIAVINNLAQYVLTACVDNVNDYLYLGTDNGSIHVIDISDLPGPPQPRINFGTTNQSVNGLSVSNNTLYCAYGNTGFVIFDVTSPLNPLTLSVTNTPGSASDIIISLGYAFVADSYNGTLIYNVSNTSAPSLLSRIPPNGQIFGVAINNNTLYTADNSYGVESVNISSPSLPSENGSIKLNSSASNIYYFGGYLYLAAAEGGLAILQPVN